jgi:hypothetical protein
MPSGYKATVHAECWKEHTCCYCGNVYRYRLDRRSTGVGSSDAAATKAAGDAVARALQRDVEMRPCPECGRYQPDMIGARRARLHGMALIEGLILFPPVLLFGLAGTLPADMTLLALVAIGGLALFAHLFVGSLNPNRRPERNKAYAGRLVADGNMQSLPELRDPEAPNRPVPITTGAGFWFCFVLLLLTLLAIPAAEETRLAAGWPFNADWHPAAVGPGDSAWLWLPHTVTSIKGYWRASTARCRVVNARQVGLASDDLSLTTRDTDWDKTINPRTQDEQADTPLWVRVQVPTNARLEGQTLQLRIEIKVRFPVPDANNPDGFQEREQPVLYTTNLALGSPRAGLVYRTFWLLGTFAGVALFFLGGWYYVARARALARCGLPTRVIPIEETPTAP